MGKKKRRLTTTLHKKVNPQKSNKMIYAVGAGLALILIVALIFFISGSSSPVNKQEAMDDTLDYLDKLEGLDLIKKVPEENKVYLIYDTAVAKNKERDFKPIARFAGIKLSNVIESEEIQIILCADRENNPECTYIAKNSLIIKEIRHNVRTLTKEEKKTDAEKNAAKEAEQDAEKGVDKDADKGADKDKAENPESKPGETPEANTEIKKTDETTPDAKPDTPAEPKKDTETEKTNDETAKK